MAMDFQASDPSAYFVGTDTGYVLHSTRFSHLAAASPAVYHSSSPCPFLPAPVRAETEAVARDPKYGTVVHSLQQCPTDPDYLLAGFSDGSLSLYKVQNRLPVHTFEGFTSHALIDVQWSRSDPGIFFALDSAGVLFAFDLLAGRPDARCQPVASAPLT
eukprot:RCo039070